MPLDKKNNKKPSVYFIVPAPGNISPGQRFRFEHYLPIFKEKGIRFRVSNFYTLTGWNALYTPGNKIKKLFLVVAGLFRRWIDLFRLSGYSYVYLYREAAPLGPPFFEWVIAKILRKKIIYDFDDAIWIPFKSEYNKGASSLKNFGKVSKICRWSYKVSVGNEYLATFARKYNSKVIIIPTVVNTETVHNRLQNQQTQRPSIGWTGTFSTLKYLDMLLPVLQELQVQYPFTFIVIADKDPKLLLTNYRFIKWSSDNEAGDLLNFHIGLMPLNDDEISKGKCGFKAIQYMSLGIPAVVSPVGVNRDIVDNYINGFITSTTDEWKMKLELLLTDTELRVEMGKAAKEKIEIKYSVNATKWLFLELFK
jgi:glycosyltransferase involved in cell wall biosynthesis